RCAPTSTSTAPGCGPRRTPGSGPATTGSAGSTRRSRSSSAPSTSSRPCCCRATCRTSSDMGWLDDHRVLVTGAGSGLGRAIVGRFIDEGAQVGALELDAAKAADLTSTFGERVAVTIGDATVLADNQRAVAETVSAFGSLDVFIGNAGLWDYGVALDAL